MENIAVQLPVTEISAPKRAGKRAWRRAERLPGEPRRIAYVYLAIPFLIYAAFTIVPLVQSFDISFYNWDGITPGTWVGLANYKSFFADPVIRGSYLHTLVLIVFYSFIPTAIGLVFLRRPWLGDFHFALPAVGVFGAWEEYGFCMIVFIAGVMKIPTSLYEAARVDGANAWHEFFAVTLPGLRYELTVVVVLTMIDALSTFDEVYVMTGGGPGTATTVPAFEVYNQAFLQGQVGSAAAIGITLMLVVFAVSYGITKILEPRGE